ncbi:zinc finger protein CONSTANS-LIKE 13-like [Tasmannia lanceolata]|uniref:zinc finger protein CONSTANS-LIKE 13-like n=1 Tax=Tasmannia lanceolata TaxID=3420 RepID=UPI0040636AB1
MATSPRHLCDHCSETQALLYCRADLAKLCLSCDRQVHAANPLFAKHTRFQLCDSCSSNPASIRCSTENLLLCQNCDFDSHSHSHSSLHDRRPLDGFSGCPSAIDLSSIIGFEDKSLFLSCNSAENGDWFMQEGENMGEDEDGFLDQWVWETPNVVSLEDLIVPMSDSCRNFQAMGFIPPPKHRNTACGKYKEEILRQLHDLNKSESHMNNDHEEFDSAPHSLSVVPGHNLQLQGMGIDVEHDAASITVPGSKASALQCHGNSHEPIDQVLFSYKDLLGSSKEESSSVSERPTHVNVSEIHANNGQKDQQDLVIKEIPSLPPKGVHELTGPDRDLVISRYKEKKKTRRYDRHIRYESRKARADNRARIRGRFAKVNQDQNVDRDVRRI